MAPSRSRLRGRPRAGLALACLAFAAGLHGVALALADGASALQAPARHVAAAERPRSLLLLPPHALRGPGDEPARGPAADPTAPAAAGRERPPPAPADLLPQLQLARAGRGEQAIRFYRLSEVEAPAEPEDDWPLDVGALDALGLDRLAFELLVDDRGRIVACRLLQLPNLAAELRLELERRLADTPMRPAVRAGLRVASVRHVELYVDVSGGT